MTEVKSNIWGRYSEDDVRIIREENRILEMRWEVFEGLYDRTRQELEKVQYVLAENARLRQELAVLEDEKNHFSDLINDRDNEIERFSEDLGNLITENGNLQKLCNEAVLENEELHKQIALCIDPLKSMENKQGITSTVEKSEENVAEPGDVQPVK